MDGLVDDELIHSGARNQTSYPDRILRMAQMENSTSKRLVRVRKDRKIAGVCTGFAAYFNVDPVLVRVIWIALSLVGGSGVLLYLIAWMIMPLEGNE
jgi:phage shock protein C